MTSNELKIHGVLELYSETGTEGGWWTINDDRTSHGEVEKCPWSERPCPGMRSYWTAWPGGYVPDELGHGNYEGIWILRTGDKLVLDNGNEIDVDLIEQDPYLEDSKDAFGWAIHHYQKDWSMLDWAPLFDGHVHATVYRQASPDDKGQNKACEKFTHSD